MSYSNATFYMDYTNGSDTARTALTSCVASNPSGTTTLITKVGHGLVTGAVVDLTGFTAWLNSAWKITRVDNDTFTLDGAVWQTTGDPNGTVTPRGGMNWADAWKTFTNGATSANTQGGDIVRIAESPIPTSIGSATWNGTGLGVAKTITSSTNATPIVITSTAHGYIDGDYVQINNHQTNTNANGFWVVDKLTDDTFALKTLEGGDSVGNGIGTSGTVSLANSRVVTLGTSGLTSVVNNCESIWSANPAGDTTPSLVTNGSAMEGGNCAKFLLDSSVQVSTMQAYFDLYTHDTTVHNLSGFQKLSFWIYSEVATADSDRINLTLCSNADGTGVVDTFKIPALSAATWTQVCIAREGGGNLGSAIKSIAFNTGTAAPTASKFFYLDNVIATTTDGLNHGSLISKNTTAQGGTEGWYPIQAIVDTIVVLGNGYQANSNEGRGYYGSSGSATTYKRETIKTAPASAAGSTVFTIQKAGTFGSNIQYQGGYNTSTNEQTGETIFDGQNCFGLALFSNNRSFLDFNHIGFYRYYYGVRLYGNFNISYKNSFFGDCSFGFPVEWNICNNYFENIISVNNSSSGISLINAYNNIFKNCTSDNNLAYSYNFSNSYKNIFYETTTCRNNAGGFTFGYAENNYFYKVICANNTTDISAGTVTNYFYDSVLDSSKITTFTSLADAKIYSHRHNDTDDNHYTFTDGGTINFESGTDHTGATKNLWKFTISSSSRNSGYKLKEIFAKYPVNAGQTLTVKVWVKKGHATNVGASISCRAEQLNGVVATETTKANDTNWEELTLTLQPTETGVLEITVNAWYVAGNESVYFDDFSATWS